MSEKLSDSKARAQVLKKALLSLMTEVTNTKQKKEAFGEFTGLSASGVDSFIYEGRGSFETWVNALLYRFELDPEEASEKIPSLLAEFKTNHPQTESDKLWQQLSKNLSEDEKVLALTLVKTAFELMRKKKSR
jgi:hypothetical protein